MARVLIGAAVLHFLVLPQIGGTRKALGLVAGMNRAVVVTAVVLEAGSLVAYAQLSRVLVASSTRPSLWTAVRVVLSSLAVNHLVPGGAAAGGALQYQLLTRRGVSGADASFVMAAQSVGSAVVLNVMLWVALLWSIPATGFQPVYAVAAVVGASLIAAVAAGVVALTRGRRRVIDRLCAAVGRLPRVDAATVARSLQGAAAQLSALLSQRRRAATATGWAAANWLLDAAVLWVLLAALGHRASIPGVLVAYGLANVLAAVPLSPGGLGIVEATLVATLAGFGVPRAHAGLAVTAYRLLQFWLPIPAGAAAWASLTGRRRRDAFEDLTRATPGPRPDDPGENTAATPEPGGSSGAARGGDG